MHTHYLSLGRLQYTSAMMMGVLQHYKLTVTQTYVYYYTAAIFISAHIRIRTTLYFPTQTEENFYTCAWSYDTETGESLLAVAGFKGIIRVIETSHVTCRAVSEIMASLCMSSNYPKLCVCVCVCMCVVIFWAWACHQ